MSTCNKTKRPTFSLPGATMPLQWRITLRCSDLYNMFRVDALVACMHLSLHLDGDCVQIDNDTDN